MCTKKKMASEDEEDELQALRSAVLASMKTRSVEEKDDTSQDETDEDPELAALRAAALKTKGQNSTHTRIVQSPKNLVYQHSHQYFNNSNNLGQAAHFPGIRGRGRGYVRGQRGRPIRGSFRHVQKPVGNLLFINTVPEPGQDFSGLPGNFPPQKGDKQAAGGRVFLRPQDKWAGSDSNSAASTPTRSKVSNKFSRFDSSGTDTDSESDFEDFDANGENKSKSDEEFEEGLFEDQEEQADILEEEDYNEDAAETEEQSGDLEEEEEETPQNGNPAKSDITEDVPKKQEGENNNNDDDDLNLESESESGNVDEEQEDNSEEKEEEVEDNSEEEVEEEKVESSGEEDDVSSDKSHTDPINKGDTELVNESSAGVENLRRVQLSDDSARNKAPSMRSGGSGVIQDSGDMPTVKSTRSDPSNHNSNSSSIKNRLGLLPSRAQPYADRTGKQIPETESDRTKPVLPSGAEHSVKPKNLELSTDEKQLREARRRKFEAIMEVIDVRKTVSLKGIVSPKKKRVEKKQLPKQYQQYRRKSRSRSRSRSLSRRTNSSHRKRDRRKSGEKNAESNSTSNKRSQHKPSRKVTVVKVDGGSSTSDSVIKDGPITDSDSGDSDAVPWRFKHTGKSAKLEGRIGAQGSSLFERPKEDLDRERKQRLQSLRKAEPRPDRPRADRLRTDRLQTDRQQMDRQRTDRPRPDRQRPNIVRDTRQERARPSVHDRIERRRTRFFEEEEEEEENRGGNSSKSLISVVKLNRQSPSQSQSGCNERTAYPNRIAQTGQWSSESSSSDEESSDSDSSDFSSESVDSSGKKRDARNIILSLRGKSDTDVVSKSDSKLIAKKREQQQVVSVTFNSESDKSKDKKDSSSVHDRLGLPVQSSSKGRPRQSDEKAPPRTRQRRSSRTVTEEGSNEDEKPSLSTQSKLREDFVPDPDAVQATRRINPDRQDVDLPVHKGAISIKQREKTVTDSELLTQKRVLKSLPSSNLIKSETEILVKKQSMSLKRKSEESVLIKHKSEGGSPEGETEDGLLGKKAKLKSPSSPTIGDADEIKSQEKQGRTPEEMVLDERILKIQERNRAILRRQIEVIEDKKKYG